MALETMTKLASYTVSASGGDSSVTLSNIPQGYTDLVVKVSARDTANNGGMYMRLNGTTTGYTAKGFYGSGSAAASENLTNGALLINPGGNTANVFSNTEITISKYSLNNYKVISCDAVSENNATTTYSEIFGELWSNSSPVTSLVFSAVSGNLAQHSSFTLYGIKNARQTAGNSIKATGGNIVFDGTYVYHVFNATGAFTPSQPMLVDYFVVAGGGGGGGAGATWSGSGGGGGGQILSGTTGVVTSSNVVTVGAGGSGGSGASPNNNNAGSSSSFATFSATGGARGIAVNGLGNNGGASGSGNSGGTGAGSTSPAYGGGGGGGNSAAGQNGASTGGGAGGAGTSYSIAGYSLGYAGGGGGGNYGGAANAGTGLGTDGGGNGNTYNVNGGNGNPGTANRGGGGGGAGGGSTATTYDGGAGGSGIVIVRYKG